MMPLDTHGMASWVPNVLSLVVGLGFGAVLESSGFGDSRKLAAQFYLRDMTVLKVMFGAIITAAGLIVLGSALGLVNYDSLYVNPTYLWPQIVGGLIMGVGFIVGGFCPGTSLVAASTLKIDGMVFFLGVAAGILAFGESLGLFEGFFDAGYMGRFTVGDWLGIDLGWALLAVVLMALAMFWGGELAEAVFGKRIPWAKVKVWPCDPRKLAAAGILVAASLAAALIGQPGSAKRWAAVQSVAGPQLEKREIYVSPAEVVETRGNPALTVLTLDLRAEGDYNLFHLKGAQRVEYGIDSPGWLRRLGDLPDNTVVFLIGNDEQASTSGWKALRARNLPNIYVVEGGYNHWLAEFPLDACLAKPYPKPAGGFRSEQFQYFFSQAVGETVFSAHPECPGCRDPEHGCESKRLVPHSVPALPTGFERKVKIRTQAKQKGGCG